MAACAREAAASPWRPSEASKVAASLRRPARPARPAARLRSPGIPPCSSAAPYSSSASPSASPAWLSYHVAASFVAKDCPFIPAAHVFHFSSYNRIQPARLRPESGHDAFFVSRVNDSGAVALGVADGVGGWTESGVDPADFSHGFCDYMAAAAYQHAGPAPTARALMQSGYDAVCVDGSLLGDSGFLHLRLNAVNAFSEPQTHAFNTPFQLSLIPPRLAARMTAFGGVQLSDLPRDADVSQLRLRRGDVLLLATDGILDNLFNQDILRIASRVMVSSGAWTRHGPAGGVAVDDCIDVLVCPPSADKSTTLQSLLATELVAAAKGASINTKLNGPFAKEVRKYYPHEPWRGGKVDDICVVAVVCDD